MRVITQPFFLIEYQLFTNMRKVLERYQKPALSYRNLSSALSYLVTVSPWQGGGISTEDITETGGDEDDFDW